MNDAIFLNEFENRMQFDLNEMLLKIKLWVRKFEKCKINQNTRYLNECEIQYTDSEIN